MLNTNIAILFSVLQSSLVDYLLLTPLKSCFMFKWLGFKIDFGWKIIWLFESEVGK